jgi:S1-C subfamily serine protease
MDNIPAVASARLGQVLAERHVDLSAKWPGGETRGLRDLFRESVSAVPLVIAKDGTGSSVVVRVDRQKRTGLLVTNHHVVESPFFDEDSKVRFVGCCFTNPR